MQFLFIYLFIYLLTYLFVYLFISFLTISHLFAQPVFFIISVYFKLQKGLKSLNHQTPHAWKPVKIIIIRGLIIKFIELPTVYSVYELSSSLQKTSNQNRLKF